MAFGLTAFQLGALAVGTAGVGATLYGANKQANAQEAAANANRESAAASEKANWDRYMMTRGIDPTNGNRTINARLPVWANVDVTRPSSTSFRLVKKGTSAVPQMRINGLTRGAPASGQAQQGGGGYSASSGYDLAGGGATNPAYANLDWMDAPTGKAPGHWTEANPY